MKHKIFNIFKLLMSVLLALSLNSCSDEKKKETAAAPPELPPLSSFSSAVVIGVWLRVSALMASRTCGLALAAH